MIKFRQKMYALPALLTVGNVMNGAMTVGTVGSLFQGHSQMKQAEEHQEENARLQKQQIAAENKKAEAIQNLANSGNAGTVGAQAMQYAASDTKILKNQRLFAARPRSRYTMKDITGFGKDVIGHIKKNKGTIIGFGAFGVGMPLGKYAVDKAIQKDDSVMKNIESGSQPIQRGYSAVKKNGGLLKATMGSVAMGAVFGGLLGPGLNYISDKNQQRQLASQVRDPRKRNSSEAEQRSYSFSFKKAFRNSGWGRKQSQAVTDRITSGESKLLSPKTWHWVKGTKENLARGLASFYNTFNMMGGEKGMASFKKSLTGPGSSGSRISKKVVGLMDNHGATSLAAIGAIGGGALFKGSDLIEKGTEKVLRKVDKNAFKYSDSKEQEMN